MPRKRKKASEVFRDREFMLAEKVPFDKAFPEIGDIKIEVIESGKGVYPYSGERRCSKPVDEVINILVYPQMKKFVKFVIPF